MQLPQLAPGRSQLADQHPPRVPIGLERVGLATSAIQRQHQLAAEALAETVLVHERFELGHEPVVMTECQVRVDSILKRREVHFL